MQPSAFDTKGLDLTKLTDEEIEEIAAAESEASTQTTSLAKAASCGIVYEQLPDDYKMELLDTKHPNDKTQDFIKMIGPYRYHKNGPAMRFEWFPKMNDQRIDPVYITEMAWWYDEFYDESEDEDE